MDTAKGLYNAIDSKMIECLDKAANAGVRVIKRLKPQLWNPNGNEPLYLSIQADSAGMKGDVRDVVCLHS